MQLGSRPRARRGNLLAAAALVMACWGGGAAWAGVEAESRVTYFREPARANPGVTVIHPQTDVAAKFGDAASINVSYEVDMVSGATPKLYSAQVDAVSSATKFDDLRQAVGGGAGWNMANVGLSAAYSYGWESDYLSHTMQVAARGDFLDRNFTLGLAYTRNMDTVCDQNNANAQGPLDRKALVSSENCFKKEQNETVDRSVIIDSFEPSLAWTATPRLLFQFGATLQVVRGFQGSPYRQVLLGNQGRTPQESLPEERERFALFARAHFAIPAIRAAVLLSGRAYRDTWDVMAGSGEVTFQKYLASALIASVRGRYHRQSGSIFYRSGFDYETKGPAGQFWTGDRELAPFSTMVAGFKLAYIRRNEKAVDAFLDEVEISLKFDGMFYDIAKEAPNSDRKMALVGQAGLVLRF